MTTSAHNNAAEVPEWGYGDCAAQWETLTPEFALCSIGEAQSPIDIATATSGPPARIAFNYHPVPLELVNNGRTVQLNCPSGGWVTVDGRAYVLQQLHFHAPSEHAVSGQTFPMEIHLVHRDGDGQTGVLAAFVQAGQKNDTIATLWTHRPSGKGIRQRLDCSIDPGELLPANGSYYSYAGSLTTPPCSESIDWLLLRTPIQASPAQIDRFRAAFGANARPRQPLNDRRVTLRPARGAKTRLN